MKSTSFVWVVRLVLSVLACLGSVGTSNAQTTDIVFRNGFEFIPRCTAQGGDLIYVLDDSSRLLSFDPRSIGAPMGPFQSRGILSCPAASTPVPGWVGPVAPFSMSVDDGGLVWVLYTSGEIFKVRADNPSSCTNSGFAPRQGNQWSIFGMAFVTDAAGGNTERIYVGGGSPAVTPGGLFGSVDPGTLMIQNLGNLPSGGDFSPDLSGTRDAELFGFYPGISAAFVQGINRANGSAQGAQMAIPGGLGSAASAWAFAQWGGKFYVFVTTTNGSNVNSTVRRFDKVTGAYEGVILQKLPYVVVSAGVSTCAPVTAN